MEKYSVREAKKLYNKAIKTIIKQISWATDFTIVMSIWIFYAYSVVFIISKIFSGESFTTLFSIPSFIILSSISFTALTFTYAVAVMEENKKDKITNAGERMFYSTILFIFGLILNVGAQFIGHSRENYNPVILFDAMAVLFIIVGFVWIVVSAVTMSSALTDLKEILEKQARNYREF